MGECAGLRYFFLCYVWILELWILVFTWDSFDVGVVDRVCDLKSHGNTSKRILPVAVPTFEQIPQAQALNKVTVRKNMSLKASHSRNLQPQRYDDPTMRKTDLSDVCPR